MISTPLVITTISPNPSPALTLVMPAYGSAVTTTRPDFSWNPFAGALTYTLQISDSISFSTLVINQSGIPGTAYTPAVNLTNSQTYWWRVQAVSFGGSTLATAAPWTFSTNPETFTVSPSSLTFSCTEGGANPLDQGILMTDTGNLGSGITWTASSDQPWLTISPPSGGSTPSLGTPLNVHVNATYQIEGWIGAISTVGAPTARRVHSAVWAANQMVIWGGSQTSAVQFNDGARYDPSTDTWLGPTSLPGAPTARHLHSGIWTGSEMIVWGGWSQATGYVDTGGTYAPDSWLGSTSTIGALSAREAHTAVWSGNRMILWGGWSNGINNSGALYDPSTDTWTGSTTTTGAPLARQEHVAVWTGSRMIVWGGRYMGAYPWGGSLNSGGFYDPATDTWTGTTTTTGAPTPRIQPCTVWTGREMIIWGGFDQDTGNVYYADGKRYDPATDTWVKSLPTVGAPSARMRHRAVWTGTQMIVWGGEDASGPLDTGAIYQPPIPAVGLNTATIIITASGPGGPSTQTITVTLTVN